MDALGLGSLKRTRTADALGVKATASPTKSKDGEESVTEDESGDEAVTKSRKVGNGHGNGLQEPTPARSQSPELVFTQSRIIGNEYPLKDFRKNLKKRGDIVSTLADELGDVVLEILMQNFASKRHDEMMECLKEYREMALKVSVFGLLCKT